MRTIPEIAYAMTFVEDASKAIVTNNDYPNMFLYELLPLVITIKENAYYNHADRLEIYDTFVEFMNEAE